MRFPPRPEPVSLLPALLGLNRLRSGSIGVCIRRGVKPPKRRGRNRMIRTPDRRCSGCGRTAWENRASRSRFRCAACGHQGSADLSAARAALARLHGGQRGRALQLGMSFGCRR
ncbi:hypothetical protein SAMN00790413_01214 [Deinococcus hopiensis KR-140]|uniref:Transposase n=1 Tax=Deinococcus hopiensis KR-140 TaxID=695939 RepID=A0A1W1VEI6_9DEIO|nr:hypothetical protein SAMN00790413_01214 [Deinococcus hopiensis KR-140]